MQKTAGAIAPSTGAPTGLILGIFLIALIVICGYSFIWRNT